MTPVLDKLLEYKRNWIQHIKRMFRNRLPRVIKHYSPTGRRNHGRLLKRLLVTWEEERVNKWPNFMTFMIMMMTEKDLCIRVVMLYTQTHLRYRLLDKVKEEHTCISTLFPKLSNTNPYCIQLYTSQRSAIATNNADLVFSHRINHYLVGYKSTQVQYHRPTHTTLLFHQANKKKFSNQFLPFIKDRLTTKIKLTPNFTAIVSAHGKTKAYRQRFKIIDLPECPCDGGNQTVDHLL
jgi:hypothetical protein